MDTYGVDQQYIIFE